MNDPIILIFIILVCVGVFYAKGGPAPSINKLVESTATNKAQAGNRIMTVGYGQEINLAGLAFPGKVTIVDFFSQGCGPCVQIRPLVHAAVERNPGLALRVVDINRPGTQGIDWGSPVARQNGLSSIPFFVVFDGKGEEIARGSTATNMVLNLINNR